MVGAEQHATGILALMDAHAKALALLTPRLGVCSNHGTLEFYAAGNQQRELHRDLCIWPHPLGHTAG